MQLFSVWSNLNVDLNQHIHFVREEDHVENKINSMCTCHVPSRGSTYEK